MFQSGLGAGAGSGLIDAAPAGRFGAEENIFLRGEVEREIELLIDHRNALEAGIVGVFRLIRLTAQLHRAGISGMSAAKNFHQGAFTRTILPDQGVNFAGGNRE